MLKSLPFGRRMSLTLKRVSRQLRGPHYIVQSIALSTRNFSTIYRLPPLAPTAIAPISRCSIDGPCSTFVLGAYRMIFVATVSGIQEIAIVTQHHRS